MGIILRRTFKGTHLWIPPIKEQIDLNNKIKKMPGLDLTSSRILNRLPENSKYLPNADPVKIDAMFFPNTEEQVCLLGDELKPIVNDFDPLD